MLQIVITIPNPAAAITLLPDGMKDVAVQGLLVQPRGTNNAKSYVGTASVSATDYMFAVNPGDGSDNPPAPIVIMCAQGSLGMLSQLYAFGAAGEILHLTVIPR